MAIAFTNKKVFDFYQMHGLDPEHVNVMFVDILEKLLDNLDTKQTLTGRILEKLETIPSGIALKLAETRKEYMDDMRLVLSHNNVECIRPLIKETNASFLDKTSLVLNELMPKNLQEFHARLTSTQLDKESLGDFLKNMNQAIALRLTETERKIGDMKEMHTANHSLQQTLQTNVSEILKKFENGSSKGAMSEHILYNILLSLFPCASIDHVGADHKESGDIILVRNGKPKILIENKDHETKNVTKQEVDKFIRDCDIQNCCGIMLAQHRGICNKENFELQVHKNTVLLYMHNVGFDNEKIRNAIEVVEHFKMKLDEVYVDKAEYVIDQAVLEQINKEFEEYVAKKDGMVKMVRDFSEKMILSINEFKFPSLEKYLSSRFATSTVQNESVCKYCGRHFPRSVAQHMRHCSKKREQEAASGGGGGGGGESEENEIIPAPAPAPVKSKGKK